MFSARFDRAVRVTDHARRRMIDRNIDDALLLDIIESGTLKDAGNDHCWLFKAYPDRDDNYLCVAALLADALIVKTVMHHFAET